MNYRFSFLIIFLGVALALGQFFPQDVLSAAEKKQRAQDPTYLQLRNMVIGETQIANVNNLVLKKDVGTFTLKSGQLVLLPPVLDRVTGAVFVGEGEFLLEPAISMEKNYLKIVYGQETIREPFTAVTFRFTDSTLEELSKGLSFETGTHPRAAEIFKNLKQYLREHAMPNQDALLLADLYDESSPGYFEAFIKGKKYERLIFSVNPRGIDPDMGPDEVSLVRFNPQHFGIWYLSHLKSEWDRGTASSNEEKFIVDAENISIDALIGSGEKLIATADITFTPLVTGPRVLHLGLSRLLRVSRVEDEEKRELLFIQEGKKRDGSFHVIFPAPLEKGGKRKFRVEYAGEKVVRDAGGGSFYVGNRTSWYPSLNAFNDYCTYDLIFRIPKKYNLVATGNPVEDAIEDGWRVSRWTSEVPLPVAGFNYANYKKKSLKDEKTQMDLEVYSTSKRPDWLQIPQMDLPSRTQPGRGSNSSPISMIRSITPTRLAQEALIEGQGSIQLFTHYFGKLPYTRVAISQQPNPNFGQAWPMLVFLPMTSFMDRTQLHFLFGSQGLRRFRDEVGSHEIAHQWWGHMVGWKSYHDQWLSEGFAVFSAGLYLQQTKGAKRAREYWRDQRKTALEKNNYGYAPNDAGPIWMGRRLGMHEKLHGSYRLVYAKGGYVLNMLRMLMQDSQTGDQRFIAMMKDFTKTYAQKQASTEDFKRIAEKHMTPEMNLGRNGKLDWFFRQWVYGTEIPTYNFTWDVKKGEGKKYAVSFELTQSGVSPNFAMNVPVYIDFGKERYARLGLVPLVGNTTVPYSGQMALPSKPNRLLINAHEDVLCFIKGGDSKKKKGSKKRKG